LPGNDKLNLEKQADRYFELEAQNLQRFVYGKLAEACQDPGEYPDFEDKCHNYFGEEEREGKGHFWALLDFVRDIKANKGVIPTFTTISIQDGAYNALLEEIEEIVDYLVGTQAEFYRRAKMSIRAIYPQDKDFDLEAGSGLRESIDRVTRRIFKEKKNADAFFAELVETSMSLTEKTQELMELALDNISESSPPLKKSYESWAKGRGLNEKERKLVSSVLLEFYLGEIERIFPE